MESLTGFFILEGLLFDIIGAYIIVTGLFVFGKNTHGINTVTYAWDLKNIDDEIQKLSEDISYVQGFKPPTMDNAVKKRAELAQLRINTLYVVDLSGRITDNFKQHDNARNKAIRGLPFLIGGFLLQGIGVIIQLV